VKQDVKLLLGLTRDDLWALPSAALMFVAAFFADVRVVAGLLAVAGFCLSIYLLRTLKKYVRGPDLSPATRVVGVAGNLLVVVFLAVVMAGMILLAADGTSAVEYLRQRTAIPPADGAPFK
jgi:hypothetical protein